MATFVVYPLLDMICGNDPREDTFGACVQTWKMPLTYAVHIAFFVIACGFIIHMWWQPRRYRSTALAIHPADVVAGCPMADRGSGPLVPSGATMLRRRGFQGAEAGGAVDTRYSNCGNFGNTNCTTTNNTYSSCTFEAEQQPHPSIEDAERWSREFNAM